MKWTHFLLALAVMAIWGTNFVVIAWALQACPPLMFAALRFFFSAVPALFFIKRPDTPWRYLAAYGVLLGAGQFGLLFLSPDRHTTPPASSTRTPPTPRAVSLARRAVGWGAGQCGLLSLAMHGHITPGLASLI